MLEIIALSMNPTSIVKLIFCILLQSNTEFGIYNLCIIISMWVLIFPLLTSCCILVLPILVDQSDYFFMMQEACDSGFLSENQGD